MMFIILISSIYEIYGGGKPSKGWFYTIITILALTAGLAYAISPDWHAYWTSFEYMDRIDFSELFWFSEMMDMEIGYIFINKLVSSLGLGYASFTLLLAVISLGLKASSIYRYGGFVFMALLMYYIPTYFFEENVHVRQGMANAIMIYSVRFIIERKLRKFLICFVIAFLFHKAVVAFLFAYWIAKIRFNNLTISLIVGASIIANMAGLSNVIDGVMQFMPFGVADSYNDYVNQSLEASILGDIVKIITVIVLLMYNKKVTERDELFSYFRNIYIFGVVLYFFFGQGIFAARLPGFYTVYIIFVVPRMIYALRYDVAIKNFIYIGFTAYTLLLYINFYNVWGDKSGFGNYRTVFSTSEYGFFKTD